MKSCYLTALIAMAAMGQNVPMFRGNLQHTGVYDGAGVRRLPHVEWRFKTQGKVISSPGLPTARCTPAARITICTPWTNAPER